MWCEIATSLLTVAVVTLAFPWMMEVWCVDYKLRKELGMTRPPQKSKK